MNDFGTFQALEQAVRQDEFLAQRIRAVVTELKPELMTPYILVVFEQAEVDLPCFIQTVLVTAEISIVSDYHGEQQIQDLLSRLDHVLEGNTFAVHVRALDLQGDALFKKLGFNIDRDKKGSTRVGRLRYQIRLKINRRE